VEALKDEVKDDDGGGGGGGGGMSGTKIVTSSDAYTEHKIGRLIQCYNFLSFIL
jgi:hypothetical protein